ncbi:neuronal pentraxin receptor b isoform X1 [Electrophorus electricus]|uniref:Pentraxin (PTX) domain-containing protein n=1 Tax=Electrophorus electricus TaxID=8005 RepID=A0A4W4HR09_ELEEL|nr:neuronal pentraxin receptor b isoform X1 [Electrophorus electricus]
MKFVVILVAAGMLAFLGVVICVIASVYPRSSFAAPHALTGNRSLSTDVLLHSLSPGSVAHAGPLGALRGSDSYEDGGLGLGVEVPFLNELSPGEVTGTSPKQFTFDRLICTPIPPGECKKRSLKRADYPYADEDWSYLSATAEELRQTVIQQNDQILTDQRTIKELTGKLSECESGLEERSLSERSLGVWAGNRRPMAGDDVSMSVAMQLQTARAVEELEKAILQLKDRIEKLELEMVPVVLNHSETVLGAPGLGQPGGQVEDMGNALEQKVTLLAQERKNLREETQGHHRHIDQGINALQDRITELEQSLNSYPMGYKLSFPMRTDYMYGLVRQNIPEMYAFTACLWLKAAGNGIGTPFSYAVTEQPNELVLLQGVHSPAELLLNDKVAQLPLSFPQGIWQHVCVSWTLRDGIWKAYQGGKLKGRGEGLSPWHPIRGGGVMVLGQEQDTLGGRFDASQALVGELSLFNLWDRVLPSTEVAALASCGKPTLQGSVVPWTERDVDMFGGATKEPEDPCSRDAGPQE